LDLFGEVPAGGSFEELLPFTDEVDVMGIRFRCVNLDKLIELKRSAGRPKDNEAIAELEVVRQETQRLQPRAPES
jgi:predicted nucleotidyltransferase